MALYDIPIHTLQGADAQARRLRRQDPAARQRRLQVRPHPPVRRARAPAEDVRRPRLQRHRLPLQPVPRPGAGHGRGDRAVLLDHLRRDVPADGEDRRQRRRPSPDLRRADREDRRRGERRRHHVELREVPREPEGRDRGAVPARRWSRRTRPSWATSRRSSPLDSADPSRRVPCVHLRHGRLADRLGGALARGRARDTRWPPRRPPRESKAAGRPRGCSSTR